MTQSGHPNRPQRKVDTSTRFVGLQPSLFARSSPRFGLSLGRLGLALRRLSLRLRGFGLPLGRLGLPLERRIRRIIIVWRRRLKAGSWDVHCILQNVKHVVRSRAEGSLNVVTVDFDFHPVSLLVLVLELTLRVIHPFYYIQ